MRGSFSEISGICSRNRQKLCFQISFATIIGLLFFRSLIGIQYVFPSKSIHLIYDELPISIQPARLTSSVSGSAYVLIALGAHANTLTCPAAIESLVRIGGWAGKVFLLTDRTLCFDKEKIVLDSGINHTNFEIIDVHEDFSSGGYSTSPKIGFRKSRVRSMTMKTRIFDFIPDKSIETLAFIDCDILVGVEGCPAKFISDGSSWSSHNIVFSRITYDNRRKSNLQSKNKSLSENNKYRISNIHSGTFIVHRQYSASVMSLWRSEMETFQYVICLNIVIAIVICFLDR